MVCTRTSATKRNDVSTPFELNDFHAGRGTSVCSRSPPILWLGHRSDPAWTSDLTKKVYLSRVKKEKHSGKRVWVCCVGTGQWRTGFRESMTGSDSGSCGIRLSWDSQTLLSDSWDNDKLTGPLTEKTGRRVKLVAWSAVG